MITVNVACSAGLADRLFGYAAADEAAIGIINAVQSSAPYIAMHSPGRLARMWRVNPSLVAKKAAKP